MFDHQVTALLAAVEWKLLKHPDLLLAFAAYDAGARETSAVIYIADTSPAGVADVTKYVRRCVPRHIGVRYASPLDVTFYRWRKELLPRLRTKYEALRDVRLEVPIESAVMELARQVVLDRPRMEEAMKKVLARAEQMHQAEDDVAKMQKQVRRLRKQIAILSDQITDEEGDNSDDPVVQKIEQAKREVEQLNVAIRLAGAKPTGQSHDPQRAIKALAEELADFGRKIDPTDVPLIPAVIGLLVSRLDVDRDTKEFVMELAVPSWLANVLHHPLPAGLEQVLACKPLIEAHPEIREILGVFRCAFERKSQCYECGRRAA